MSILTRLFLDAARLRPDAVALRTVDGMVTYAELLRRASQIAHALRERGVRSGELVGIAVPRSEEAVASVLAVLLCGCAYVPVDPDAPVERQRWITEDCGTPLVLSAGVGTADWLPTPGRLALEEVSTHEELPAEAPREGADGELLYVLYTSGSTGRPKG